MTVAVVDYGSGNLRSAAKALERVCDAGQRVAVTADADRVAEAERVVLPGVGAFADCLAGLDATPGMRAALERVARERRRPLLGICVGMQLMAARGFEHGVHEGFGWFDAAVRRLAPGDSALKVPHMGWNELEIAREHPLLEGLPAGAHAYFVHGYAFVADDGNDVVAHTDHGGRVCAAVARGNLAGAQFHPEKSQRVGLRVLANFLRWRP